MSRIPRQPEEQAQYNALRNILQGIYYRHEFGRRNSDVITRSRMLLRALEIPEPRAEHFILPDGGTLGKEIIYCIKNKPADCQQRLITQTGDFLRKHRILPMAPSKESFFPQWDKLDFDMMFMIWNALLEFEVSALARLSVGHPVLFPVMVLDRAELPDREVDVDRLLQLREYEFSLLTNLMVPKDVVLDYYTALQMQFRALHYRDKLSGKTGDKLQGATSTKGKQAEKEEWCRIPWGDAERMLKTIDFNQRTFPHGEKEQRIEVFYKQNLQKTSKRKLKGNAPARVSAISTYHKTLRRARLWKKQYRRII